MTKDINHADRDHALLSASSAHRWLACPPSAVAAEAYPAQDTEFTREGTLAHVVAELVARKGWTDQVAKHLQRREIDPEMKTPASNNLITGSSFGIVFGAPILVAVSYAAQGDTACWITFGVVLVYLAALLAFMFWKKK